MEHNLTSSQRDVSSKSAGSWRLKQKKGNAGATLKNYGSPIGQAIERVKQVDLDGGRVQITIDGFKAIVFETTVESHSSEETTVILRDELLHGYCRECLSLCHESSRCPTLLLKKERRDETRYSVEKPDGGEKSYKGALRGSGESMKDITDQEKPIGESSKGKGKITETREEKRSSRSGGLQQKANGDILRRFSQPLQPREDRKRFGGTSRSIHRSTEDHNPGLSIIKDQTEEETENKHWGSDKDSPPQHSAKKVRKGLTFEDNTMRMDSLDTGSKQVSMEESEKAVIAGTEAGIQAEERGGAEDDQLVDFGSERMVKFNPRGNRPLRNGREDNLPNERLKAPNLTSSQRIF
ncbi:unnamed protein product [Thlaspi arvense]|uniref:Zinc knuckle CX2CX4HX4C domain-containing protein n=1 Tax=Thlaspi arvense TaxID=13288 RepID=A0AAU9SQA2_THLAR|nr:unnamed protein product [Thlaspi arvense]